MSSSKKKKNFRQPPHKPGISAGYLASNFSETPATSSLKNGHVLFLYVTTDRDIKATESKLRTLTNEYVNDYAIKKLIKCFLKFKKLTDAKEFANFEKLCNVDFEVVPVTPRLNVVQKLTDSPCTSSPVKTRKTAACGNCKILRRNLQNCIREKHAIRNKQSERRKRTDGNVPKRLNERLRRKNKIISKLKIKIKAQFPDQTICKDLKNAKRREKYQKEKASNAENDKKRVTKEAASQVREIETDFQDQLLQREEELADAHSSTKNNEFSKDGKAYNLKMRIMVYECLTSNVPTAIIPGLIQSFAKRFGSDLESKDIPVRSTVENMVIELGLISDLQVAQLIYNAENVTLGFDATTQEGIHVNSIHITSKDDCLVVALDQLPGGTADDYATHIIESVEHLARVMCDFKPDNDYHEVKEKLVSHISSTMTDRAAANHAE
ncbi:hypothetical protein SNE40_019823 [Patella caerulea]|uniref:Uncharacterized protein n=1 Tax=Patella caerulea TaxID=87958 RepID=A0AAN8G9G8_PATCE